MNGLGWGKCSGQKEAHMGRAEALRNWQVRGSRKDKAGGTALEPLGKPAPNEVAPAS